MVNISILKHTNWLGLPLWLGQTDTHTHTHKGISRAISSTASLAQLDRERGDG